MNQIVFSKKSKITLVIVLIVLLGLLLVIRTASKPEVINPSTNVLDENPRAGLDYALLYNDREIYASIDGDDDNLSRIQADLAVFARAKIPELQDTGSLIGFTFESGYTKDDNIYTFYGYYYSSTAKIKVAVTVYETGAISLSILNTEDMSSVDTSLNLNGFKNQLIVKLPIESDYYSIRFLKSDDKIVASFYKGYSLADVDAVVKILNEAYEGAFDAGDVIFNINAVGNFSLEEVRAYSSNPENSL